MAIFENFMTSAGCVSLNDRHFDIVVDRGSALSVRQDEHRISLKMTASMVRQFAALSLSIVILAAVPIAATAASRQASLNREKWIAGADHLIQTPPEDYPYDWGEATLFIGLLKAMSEPTMLRTSTTWRNGLLSTRRRAEKNCSNWSHPSPIGIRVGRGLDRYRVIATVGFPAW